MDKRQFSYVAGSLDSGFIRELCFSPAAADYGNCVLNLNLIRKLSQNYQRLPKRRRRRRKSWGESEIVWPITAHASFNKVILLGNLTRDPECVTPKGSAVAISASQLIVLHDRQWREARRSDFVDVTFWGRTAEVRRVTEKRPPVFIEGRLQLDSWEDNNQDKNAPSEGDWGKRMQLIGARPLVPRWPG